jgi:nucleotide-binding universal stress UspA family protein
MRFRKILCPVDFSDGSRQAMRLAIDLLGPESQLVLVHAWQAPYVYGPEAVPPGAAFVETRTVAEQTLEKWRREAEQLGARRASAVLASGAPWHEIVEHARLDPAIDLIVMGTHGHTGLEHVLLGSVAERTVRQAPCPVLTVRQSTGPPRP